MGLVTKYAGGVVKGFALIAGDEWFCVHEISRLSFNYFFKSVTKLSLYYLGLIITGLAQWILDNKALANKDW